MILILSEVDDYSTDEVIMWLRHWEKPYIRINSIDKAKVNKIAFDRCWRVEVEGIPLDFDEISSYWYRRGDFQIEVPAEEKNQFPVMN